MLDLMWKRGQDSGIQYRWRKTHKTEAWHGNYYYLGVDEETYTTWHGWADYLNEPGKMSGRRTHKSPDALQTYVNHEVEALFDMHYERCGEIAVEFIEDIEELT